MTHTSRGRSRLPKIPDPHTGEPRPPAAPRRESSAHEATPTDRAPIEPPPPPEGLGPTLEWSQAEKKHRVQAAFALSAIVAAFATVKVGGFDWVSDWGFWVLLSVMGAVMYWRASQEWMAAGAVWVQEGPKWVNTYELVRIRFSVDGLRRVLRLQDAEGREIHSFGLRDVQSNPLMWDLVYNGILHSVASGNCDISRKARKVLQIPPSLGREREYSAD
ncbi:hypothetical protein [Rhodococcus marinonascens]|uniref:hypothetical protein n=1 Tax=Rhodococcus marinonascens TaxID=38311 RepID=UPI000B2E57F3|nr:hypothetical protein [Rhodococcus marinonascens]